MFLLDLLTLYKYANGHFHLPIVFHKYNVLYWP
nr:MAG TPA: hypothetical protein [Caudoviricetes sp.]